MYNREIARDMVFNHKKYNDAIENVKQEIKYAISEGYLEVSFESKYIKEMESYITQYGFHCRVQFGKLYVSWR